MDIQQTFTSQNEGAKLSIITPGTLLLALNNYCVCVCVCVVENVAVNDKIHTHM